MKTKLTLKQIRGALRKRGLKLTNQRHAIYRALAASQEHPTAEDLYRRVRRAHPALSINTVYNTLEALKGAGVAAQISLWHDRARYDANLSAHHHAACLACRKIVDLHEPSLNRLTLPASLRGRFTITGHHIEFHGYCRDCQKLLKKKASQHQ
jgi:Fur family transcriptional regulator, peroxide stress response regulator